MTAHATGAGLDTEALDRLRAAIEGDIEAGLYDGAVVMLGRHGEVALHEAIGWAERDTGREAQTDDIFRVLSLTKAFTNTLMLRAISRGELSTATPVVDVLPEFAGTDRFRRARKERITIGHLLTHRSGLPLTPTPVPYEQLGRLDLTLQAIYELEPVSDPGGAVNYSPALNHALMGEILRRLSGDGISMRDLLRRDLFEPLGMTSTALGAPRAWADRLVPLKARFGNAGGWLTEHDVEVLNDVISEDAEMPWVGGVTSAEDVFRLAEMLRRGGEYDGVRYIAPAVLDLATRNQTGDAPQRALRAPGRAERLGGHPRLHRPRVHARGRHAGAGDVRDVPVAADVRQLRRGLDDLLGRPGARPHVRRPHVGRPRARAEHPALPPPLRHGRGGSAVIALAEHSYLWVGVERVPGPDGTTVTAGEHMYVEYFVPQERTKPHPVILVHGGNGQGMAFLGPGGGEPGWAHHLLAEGYAVYLVDRPGLGRNPPLPYDGQDVAAVPYEAVTREFMFGAETGRWKGTGDIGDPRVDQFMAQQRGTPAGAPQPVELYKRRGGELLEAIGPAILIMHSAGGPFGWVTADARPDLVKAIVSVEALPPAMAASQLTFDPPGELDLVRGARRARRRVGPARPGAARRAGRSAAAAGEPVADPDRLPEQRRPALLGDQPRRRASSCARPGAASTTSCWPTTASTGTRTS